MARRVLKKLDKSRSPQTVDAKNLKKGDAIYYFNRREKRGKLETGYVRAVEPQFLSMPGRKVHKGKPVKAACKDIRTVQKNRTSSRSGRGWISFS